MNLGLDSEGLFAIYADWIAFLREKRVTFEGQLAKVQGKDAPGKDSLNQNASDQALSPISSNLKAQETEATQLPVSSPRTVSPRKEKKTKTPTPAPVFAGTNLLEEALPLPESENGTPPDEKTDEIPEWLWNSGASSNEGDEELPHSVEEDEDDKMDDWM